MDWPRLYHSLSRRDRQVGRAALLAVIFIFVYARPAEAYIGPGAGFALLSSFFVLFTTIVVVGLSIVAWPFRAVWRLMIRKRRPVGDPTAHRRRVRWSGSQTDRSVHRGRPAAEFQRLAEMGCARPLGPRSIRLAGGMVVVQHRVRTSAAQHLRSSSPWRFAA
jgi:hypothetical protein